MKLKKLFSIACIFALISTFVSAQEEVSEKAEKNSRWRFSTTTDFAYYPKSDYIAGDSHFAPITGAYSGLEGRVVAKAVYTLPTPMGENWLVSGANLTFGGLVELTPVSAKAGFVSTFTPLPFLVFEAGAQIGSGWNLFGLQGMASLNLSEDKYDDITPFTAAFTKLYAQGTFQFDTGAIWKGDWTHAQIMYTYQVYYEGLSSMDAQDVWMWQCTGNKTNGLCNYQSLILCYQMPLVISRAGVMCELDGHYNASDYENSDYNGNFKAISISPMAQWTFGQHDVLTTLVGFSSRRSYTSDHDNNHYETIMDFAGREWFFNRIALSWTHTF